MTADDDSTAKEIASEAARVLPLVGCPRWALWLGTLLAVVLYVVAKRVIPSLGRSIAEAIKNGKAPEAPDRPGDSPDYPNPMPQEGPPT